MAEPFQINKPGFLDFLLSGAAGAARGAVTGVTQKGEQDRQAKIQQALEDFRNRQLFLQERKGMQDVAQNVIDRLLKRSEAKKGREFKAGESALERESRELIAQIRTGGAVDPEDVALKRERQRIDIKNVESQIQQRQDQTELAEGRQAFEEDKFDIQNLQKMTELQADFAFAVFDVQTATELEKFKADVRMFAAKDDLHPFTTQALKNVSFWDYMAMTAESDKARQAAVEQSNNARKSLSIFARDLDKLEYKPAKVEFEKKGLGRVPLIGRLFGGETTTVGEPSVALPDRGAVPQLPAPDVQGLGNILQQITGVPFDTPEAAPAADVLPAPVEQLTPPPPPPTADAGFSIGAINTIVDSLRSVGVTVLDAATKKDMKSEGLTDEQIVFIEEAIAAEEAGETEEAPIISKPKTGVKKSDKITFEQATKSFNKLLETKSFGEIIFSTDYDALLASLHPDSRQSFVEWVLDHEAR